jgi:hypothetical protein
MPSHQIVNVVNETDTNIERINGYLNKQTNKNYGRKKEYVKMQTIKNRNKKETMVSEFLVIGYIS